MKQRWALVVFVALVISCGYFTRRASFMPQASIRGRTFAQRRAAFRTKLLRHGPSPQSYPRDRVPTGVQAVTYSSGSLDLQAWFSLPNNATFPCPGVVYFHGGAAFGLEDWETARPFLDAGIAVLMPMLRGENGNPGDFELMLGEQDDALAAIAWLANQDGVDRQRIYTFGHSLGGGLSALVSLDAAPSDVRVTASAGGLYGPRIFDAFARDGFVPFDLSDPDERALRLLGPNLGDMRVPHIAYMGRQDVLPWTDQIRRTADDLGSPLKVVSVPGDHGGSLAPAIQEFVKEIVSDAARAKSRPSPVETAPSTPQPPLREAPARAPTAPAPTAAPTAASVPPPPSRAAPEKDGWVEIHDDGLTVSLPPGPYESSPERLHVVAKNRRTIRLECHAIVLDVPSSGRSFWAASIQLPPDLGTPNEVAAMLSKAIVERWKAAPAELRAGSTADVRELTSSLPGGKARLHVRLVLAGLRVFALAAAVPEQASSGEDVKRFFASFRPGE